MKKIFTILTFLITSSLIMAQDFYNLDEVQTIKIVFAESNWDALLDAEKAGDENYIMAQSVTINGVFFDSVGVKYKGNSTYDARQTKNPFHIELDTYKDQKYENYTDIKLSNAAKDPSFIREVLSYKVLRNYMDAPLSNFANVYVNDKLIGLYSNSEAVSKKFVDDRFGSKSNTFVKCNPTDGAGPGTASLPNLVYKGDDSSQYYSAYELKSDTGWDELIDLCDTLKNNVADIEKILDVDRALWMLAFDNMLVNLDSYIGGFSQNYYLYRDDNGRFLPVVWDLNESFGTFSMSGSSNLTNTASKQRLDHLLHSSEASYPLISQLLSIPTYKKMYLAHCKTFLTENFTNNGPYYTDGLAMQKIIDSHVQADQNKFYTYNNFISNLTADISGGGPGPGSSTPGITTLMNGRYSYLMGLSDFSTTEPTITNVNSSTNLPKVGEKLFITAKVVNEDDVFLRYRTQIRAPFNKIAMYDDGKHNDGLANDDVYGAEVTMSSAIMEYYIYAENSTIGKFSPTNAEHEFYSLVSTVETAEGNIVINEFLASNDATNTDQDGGYDDWVELYNKGNEAINLEGYTLTDDITDFTLFAFPAGTVIQPNEYIIVWADKEMEQEGYHANLKLSASGETIYLTNATLSIIDSVSFGTQVTDVSYGRYPNGTGDFRAMSPTPGAANIIETAVSELVINEFLASNETTNVDQDGTYDDWIELYNKGTVAINLEGYRLTDDKTDFSLFAFPAGTTIQPNGYIIVWADKEMEQEGYHADLKLSASGESIYLTNAELSIIDSVSFGAQETDISYGRYPNGTGEFRTMTPTPGAMNSIETVPVEIVINEFLASNETTNVDQDGGKDDWIEIYNKGAVAVDLEGFTLTDDITDFTLFAFPAGTVIQPNEYIIVWADKEMEQDGYHADLKLSASGESFYLTNAELTIIDSVSFGEQEADISYGRYPNGTGDFRIMTPTPGAMNTIATAASEIVINELLASNTTINTDQDGGYDDWIEIYNKGSVAVDLAGYTLSDDITDFTLFAFPAGTVIQPNEYIIVWADKEMEQEGYHGDLKLSASGESLYLTNAELSIIDSVNFGAQETDISYGRYPNGTGDFRVMTPTPALENVSAISGVNDFGIGFNFNIYPNPAKDELNIIYDKGINSILILDLNGKAILSNNNLAPQMEQSINIDYLQTGTYFIKINDNIYKRFVKE
ncbi:MAG: lamin tail domain-containing protein [Candidatus Kapaibacterium sp.]